MKYHVTSHQNTSHHAAGLILAGFVALALAGCTSTSFPEDPEQHRLFEELQAAGHEYYFNLRAGVSSRVLGITPVSAARNAADEIRRRWGEIDRFDDTDPLIEYLRLHSLNAVADRIEETLSANQDDAPPEGIDERLEAAAVKQGLIDAVFELEVE